LSLLTPPPSEDGASKCSRAGCSKLATTRINWRNPKIHDADRVKVWLACDEHAPYLQDYLAARDFPVVLTPLGNVLDRLPAGADAGAGSGVGERA
jgi:hypothetical protein